MSKGHRGKGEQSASEVRVGATLWYVVIPSQMETALHTRSDVNVGPIVWNVTETLHDDTDPQTRSDVKDGAMI